MNFTWKDISLDTHKTVSRSGQTSRCSIYVPARLCKVYDREMNRCTFSVSEMLSQITLRSRRRQYKYVCVFLVDIATDQTVLYRSVLYRVDRRSYIPVHYDVKYLIFFHHKIFHAALFVPQNIVCNCISMSNLLS